MRTAGQLVSLGGWSMLTSEGPFDHEEPRPSGVTTNASHLEETNSGEATDNVDEVRRHPEESKADRQLFFSAITSTDIV